MRAWRRAMLAPISLAAATWRSRSSGKASTFASSSANSSSRSFSAFSRSAQASPRARFSSSRPACSAFCSCG